MPTFEPYVPRKQDLAMKLTNQFAQNPEDLLGTTWDEAHLDNFLQKSTFTRSLHFYGTRSRPRGQCNSSHIGYSDTNPLVMMSGVNPLSASSIASRLALPSTPTPKPTPSNTPINSTRQLQSPKEQYLALAEQQQAQKRKKEAARAQYESLRLKFLLKHTFRHGVVGCEYPENSKGLLYPLPKIQPSRQEVSLTYKTTQQQPQPPRPRHSLTFQQSSNQPLPLPPHKRQVAQPPRPYNIVSLAKI
jgi:hypothetical protein